MAQLLVTAAKNTAIHLAQAFAAQTVSNLFAPDRVTGPQLDSLTVLQSTEGAPVPIVMGRARVGGQVIWADVPREHLSETSGGKGGPATSERSYTISFAVGLCEGEIAGLGRIWADGKLLDVSGVTLHVHTGSDTQQPNSIIEAARGFGQVPAFRGLAYVVFEDFPISDFGNRIPQLSFEVQGAITTSLGQTDFRELVRAVTLIPGSGEYAYATSTVLEDLGPGVSRAENINNSYGVMDVVAALDDLERTFPNCASVSLVCSWFGTDLRAGNCQLRPGVEAQDKLSIGQEWQVSGITRADAHQVSRINDRPAFGGTPSDESMLQVIAELKSRGMRVVFYPFVMMDVPPGNGLPDPWGGAEQAAYPWRGRVSCYPAPGQAGTVDKSAIAATQTAQFFGAASASDFGISNGAVTYSGPDEWSYRRMVLHCAQLCALAGGADAFLIGSELRGLTQVRDSATTFPAVAHLRELAAQVKQILPNAKVSYAADWSEYSGYRPDDGSGDVLFHLDPLWADAHVDFVGIDWYVPLADWRDGSTHLDAANWSDGHDPDYLAANMETGEYFDWYYASSADRDAQNRTAITDGAYAKPWVFRAKDVRNWWTNAHHDRPGGVENTIPTAWVPQSKPIWFTETGCPAVDKGANQPNVFFDPKSSESALPHYSDGTRDDVIQQACVRTQIEYWSDNAPLSGLYGGPMIDPENIFIWTWDARPWPDFPARESIWADGPNWELGHWLSGRSGMAEITAVLGDLFTRTGLTAIEASAWPGLISGYVVQGGTSLRSALSPLCELYGMELADRLGELRFLPVDGETIPITSISTDVLALVNGNGNAIHTIADPEEAVRAVGLQFADGGNDYLPAQVLAGQIWDQTRSMRDVSVPLTLDRMQAQDLAAGLLSRHGNPLETVRLSLPPSQLALEVGDRVQLDDIVSGTSWKVTRIEEMGRRDILLQMVSGVTQNANRGIAPGTGSAPIAIPARPGLLLADIPLLPGEGERAGPLAGVFASPWPGNVDIRAVGRIRATASGSAMLGHVQAEIPAGGFSGRMDFATSILVQIQSGLLQSIDMTSLLNGGNLLAVQHADDAWELLQFQSAELQLDGSWKLSGLLRGQQGTEPAFNAPILVNAPVLVLNHALVPVSMTLEELGMELQVSARPTGVVAGALQDSIQEFSAAGLSLRPYAPVHLRTRWIDTDLELSWVRRTRAGGDSWFGLDVPLGEASEQYQVEVLDGAQILYSGTLATPKLIITSVQLDGMFPQGLPQAIHWRVAQISEIVGPGTWAAQTIAI